VTTEQQTPVALPDLLDTAARLARGEYGEAPEMVQGILSGIRRFLGMDSAFIGEFTPDRQVLRFVDNARDDSPVQAGKGSPLEDTYCQRVADGRLPGLIPDTAALAEACGLPITAELSIGAYLSAPIQFSDGRTYGTLCALSGEPDPSLRDRDVAVLQLLAGLLAPYLEREADVVAARERAAAEVHDVLARNALTTVFQPIVHLPTGRTVGYEALSRFPHGGPEEWFAKAADTGLGVTLELAAIDAAVAHLPRIPADVYLAVNLSPAAVRSDELAARLGSLPLSRLVVELTEHTDESANAELAEQLRPLRAAGARIAVDDAGSGYAGLQRILAIAPDVLKLDRALTRGIAGDPARQALAAAMDHFADRTGMLLVAEGIQTAEDLASLRALGVRYGQGYHLGRPGPLPG
jgi:EAL domain-containing protein (putative c-di-GMP-specific phosphodiesterase class I)